MGGSRPGDTTVRTVLAVLGVLVLLPLVMLAFSVPMMGMTGGHGYMMDGYGGPAVAPLWVIGMMVVPLLVVLAIGYLLYRGLDGGAGDPALAELRLAYARGELGDEEYEARRERLTEDRE